MLLCVAIVALFSLPCAVPLCEYTTSFLCCSPLKVTRRDHFCVYMKGKLDCGSCPLCMYVNLAYPTFLKPIEGYRGNFAFMARVHLTVFSQIDCLVKTKGLYVQGFFRRVPFNKLFTISGNNLDEPVRCFQMRVSLSFQLFEILSGVLHVSRG